MNEIEDIARINFTYDMFNDSNSVSSLSMQMYSILYCRNLLVDFMKLNRPAFKELKVVSSGIEPVKLSLRFKNESFIVDKKSAFITKKGNHFYYESTDLHYNEYYTIMLNAAEGLFKVIDLMSEMSPRVNYVLHVLPNVYNEEYITRFDGGDDFLSKIKKYDGGFDEIYERSQLLLETRGLELSKGKYQRI